MFSCTSLLTPATVVGGNGDRETSNKKKQKQCNSFKKFTKKYNAELSKYNVSTCIRTHVSQGICIPLEVKHDLHYLEDSLIDNYL